MLIDDVWSGGKASEGPYPLLSAAMQAGFYHPNCKDSHTTFFPGITEVDNRWTRRELEELGSNYALEQRQNYAIGQAKRFERLALYSLDGDNKQVYKARANKWKTAAAVGSGIQEVPDKAKIAYIDVTHEWAKVPKSSRIEVQDLQEYVHTDGVKYKVDGDNLKFEYSPSEISIANLLASYGRKVEFCPVARKKHQGMKTPDYIIDGVERWDLKELNGSSLDAIRNAIKLKKGQATHFIIDSTSYKLDSSEVERQFGVVFKAYNTSFVETLVWVHDGKVVKVLKRT